MKRHKQTKMRIENAKIHRVQKQKIPTRKQKRPIKMPIENANIHRVQKQKRPIRKQKRPIKMPIENAKIHGVPSSWWFVVVQAHTRCVTKSTTNIVYLYVCAWLCATD